MAKIVWMLTLAAFMAVPDGYTLIETYQLLRLLETPGSAFHLLEVCGINEVEVAPQPHILNAKSISLKHLSDLTSWPVLKTPSQSAFITQMKIYGIKRDHTEVVLYDRSGIVYSAKAWWVFTVFGKDNVKVLNGGLPKWMREGYATRTVTLTPPQQDPRTQNDAEYAYQLDLTRVWTISQLPTLSGMLQTQGGPQTVQLIDVRAKNLFDATSVKGSINMPIEIVRRADGTLRAAIELKVIFQMYSIKISNDTLSVVMGLNGVDSSTALLSLSVLGNDHSAIVDGGWLEYSQWLKNSAGPTARKVVIAVQEPIVVAPTHEGAIIVLSSVTFLLGVVCIANRHSRASRRPDLDISEKWL